MRAADELIDGIVNSSQIPSGKRRREVQRELRSHIEDFIVAAREAGREQDEIEKLVLANFGDPGLIAEGFAWVYRHERRRLRAFAYALSTVLLASCLLAAILATQAGLAFGFGKPIMKVLASRHTLIEALDILASVAAYLGVTSLENFFKNHRFEKAALLLTVILTILMVSCAAAGLRITFLFYGLVIGIFFRAIQLFVTPRVARVSVVLVCFPLAGLVSALLRSPVSQVTLATTCASWLAMGAGYQLMSNLAARVDAAVLNGLQRIQRITEGRDHMRTFFSILLGGSLLLALAPRGVAHFRLLEPASWLQESEELGDPQWSAPCGGTLKDPGKPTAAVTKIQGGDKLHIRIREMAFHPGFYRVALAVNSRNELPPDPEPTSEPGANGRPRSVSGSIHYPPSPPVLADGLFMHVAPFDKEQEADVEIPNVNCAKCTLQVIEFMAAHGFNPDGGYTYHHCADLQIRANPNKPIDTRFPAENKKH